MKLFYEWGTKQLFKHGEELCGDNIAVSPARRLGDPGPLRRAGQRGQGQHPGHADDADRHAHAGGQPPPGRGGPDPERDAPGMRRAQGGLQHLRHRPVFQPGHGPGVRVRLPAAHPAARPQGAAGELRGAEDRRQDHPRGHAGTPGGRLGGVRFRRGVQRRDRRGLPPGVGVGPGGPVPGEERPPGPVGRGSGGQGGRGGRGAVRGPPRRRREHRGHQGAPQARGQRAHRPSCRSGGRRQSGWTVSPAGWANGWCAGAPRRRSWPGTWARRWTWT